MNVSIKKQMRWFVLKLIDIRDDLNRTPDHVADIEFRYEDITTRQESIFGIMGRPAFQRKVKEMLVRIKKDGEFLSSFNNFNAKLLNLKVLANGNIKIIGYQKELLTTYFKKRILKGEKTFGLATNPDGQSVLTIYGENTGKRIESQEQYRAFCYFLNNPNRIIPYLEIFEEFKRGALHDGDYWHNKCPTDGKKEEFVQTTVYNLKRKLIEIGKKYDVDIDKHLETISKKGYKYNI
jgi:hypothetical protein